MSKYYGAIGYAKSVEDIASVYREEITERYYYGDIYRNSKSNKSSENLNDNISISNKVSILADPFAMNNFQAIKYATYLGTKWKVKSVEVQYPRLILELGDVYNAG